MKKTKIPQKKRSNFLLYVVPYFLVLVLAVLVFVNLLVIRSVESRSLPIRVQSVLIEPYPLFRYFYEPYVTAQSAIIIDNKTKRELFVKNPTLRLSTASTAKIMTALVALDYYEMDAVLTVMGDGYEGTVVGLQKGEQLYFKDILYAMMLPSGNDAAYTIAENYPGGVQAFVEQMNQKARSFHLQNTHFADPAGLEDDASFTTVSDLALLCSEAMKDTRFSAIVSTKEKVFSTVAGNVYDVFNINKLLGVDGVIGIKTGQTTGAGGVLTTAKVEDGRLYIIVVMQSSDRFGDTQSLLNLLSNNITYFVPKQELRKPSS
ncbi:MAG: hypothetical protein RLZZ455_28 [Candidatus Parcubacteria bacterium]|jgi:D-alanyl-D-alanine carboxypeptidase